MPGATLHMGDCRDWLATLAEGSVDAVVTDPPAGIGFMGKKWDTFVGRSNPGAERDKAAAKGRGPTGPRNPNGKSTQPFAYSGSALPKSAASRAAFVDFLSPVLAECLRVTKPGGRLLCWAIPRTSHWTGVAVEDAGWVIESRIAHIFGSGFPKGRSQLKPAVEDWWLARKPGPRVLPLGIDECRVPAAAAEVVGRSGERAICPAHDGYRRPGRSMYTHKPKERGGPDNPDGRWPANLVTDGSEEVMEAFAAFGERSSRPAANGIKAKAGAAKFTGVYRDAVEQTDRPGGYQGDTGTAARFFYAAKASRRERGEGNVHPTVKNLALMSWLVKLVAREGETVLDPFAGSGTTAVACLQTGRNFLGAELSPEYHAIAAKRIAAARAELRDGLFGDGRKNEKK